MKRCIHRSVWAAQESRIIHIFRRKAHLLLQHLPDRGSLFEWVALMQHHGAPTRLLDFTWSPYVAAFFALEQAEAESTVWAICSRKLLRQEQLGIAPVRMEDVPHIRIEGKPAVTVDPRLKEVFDRVYLPGTVPIVAIAEPDIMNQRLIAQQGTFLVPGRLDRPIEQMLADYQESDSLCVKLVLEPGVRDRAMRELLNMNITNATLFPGLDGLARSMAYEFEFHWDFDPRTGEQYSMAADTRPLAERRTARTPDRPS